MDSAISIAGAKRDQKLELKLRPGSLGEFIGQPAVREKLDVFVGAAKKRGEALGHFAAENSCATNDDSGFSMEAKEIIEED